MRTAALFDLLSEAQTRALEDALDDGPYWAAVESLWACPEVEVLEAAYGWAASPEPGLRALVADVLRGLGTLGGGHPFRDQTIRLFREMLRTERSVEVLCAIAFANTDLMDPRMAGLFLPFRKHPDGAVREAVVQALQASDAALVIEALVELSEDEVEEVRSWATHALAHNEARTGPDEEERLSDSAALRRALWERTRDRTAEVRADATLGLALRGDARARTLVARALKGARPAVQFVRAAHFLRDPSFYGALERLFTKGWGEDEGARAELKRAMEACSPRPATPPSRCS